MEVNSRLLRLLLLTILSSTVTRSFILRTTSLGPPSSSRSGSRISTNRRAAMSIYYPELVVFDLDACFWNQEMFEMDQIPSSNDVVMGDLNGRGKGVVGVMSGRNQISLHKGSLEALQQHADGMYNDGTSSSSNTKVAFASSADTPYAEKIGRASLKLLQVLPDLTVWDLVVGRDWEGTDVNQIGRQPPLSSNKAKSHFPFLKKLTGIRYDRMLFFDDCNWGDHCGMVERGCREADTDMGPATVRTPNGLGIREWQQGLEAYAKQAKKLEKMQQDL